MQYHFVTDNDAHFLWSIDQDPAVMTYLNGGKKTPWEDIQQVFLPRIKAFSEQSKGWGLWRVSTLSSPSADLGWILVRPMGFFTAERNDNNLELGWRFHQHAWGKGYATEAATQIKNTLAKSGIDQFSAMALPQNRGSIGVMKNLGLTYAYDFRYRDAVFDDDVVVYSQIIHQE
nr:GNAT family N-acetyltransferase [Alteromonas sp. C1M14]